MTVKTVGRVELNKTTPSLNTLRSIADALGIPVGDLLDVAEERSVALIVSAETYEDMKGFAGDEPVIEWLAKLVAPRIESIGLEALGPPRLPGLGEAPPVEREPTPKERGRARAR